MTFKPMGVFGKNYIMLLACFILAVSLNSLADEVTPMTIEEAVMLALKNNPYLVESTEAVNTARAGIKHARADFFPKASIHYGYTALEETPISKMGGRPIEAGHQNQYHWGVTVIQPLFTGFAIYSKLVMADLDKEIRMLEKEQAVLDITRDVQKAAFEVLLSQHILVVADEELKALTAHEKRARLFFEQKMIPKNDLLKSEVARANSRQQLTAATARNKKAKIQLNRLMAQPMDAPVSLFDENETIMGLKETEQLIEVALTQRPIIKLFDQSIKKLNAAITLARSAAYPQISLMGSHTRTGDDPGAENNDYTLNENSSISLKATWTLFNGGKVRSAAQAARAEKRRVAAKVRGMKDLIRQQVHTASLEAAVSKNNIDVSQGALNQAKENLRITNLQYQQKIATSADVLDAQALMSKAKANYFKSLYGYRMALSELDRAVGKGL